MDQILDFTENIFSCTENKKCLKKDLRREVYNSIKFLIGLRSIELERTILCVENFCLDFIGSS